MVPLRNCYLQFVSALFDSMNCDIHDNQLMAQSVDILFLTSLRKNPPKKRKKAYCSDVGGDFANKIDEGISDYYFYYQDGNDAGGFSSSSTVGGSDVTIAKMQKHFATAIFEAIEDRINEVLLLPLASAVVMPLPFQSSPVILHFQSLT